MSGTNQWRARAGARLCRTVSVLLLAMTSAAMAQPCRNPGCGFALPPGAGAVNVRDFGAKGDGKTDDTAALLAAVAASGGDTGNRPWHDQIVFLPAGTYLVTDTIVKRYANGLFASGLLLLGAGVDRTVIRLADDTPGFGDAARPRAVVKTASKLLDMGGGRDYMHKGEGNDAYNNYVENLTVDVGGGNAGAIGIDYLANNFGAIRDVLVRAPSNSGAIGIAMLRRWPGPALVQRTAVEGFDVGIAISQTEYGMTLSEVKLSGQATSGLRNQGNAISAEALSVSGAPDAVVNEGKLGLITLVDSDIGGSLRNEGTVVLRNTRIPGQPRDGIVVGTEITAGAPPMSLPRPRMASVDPGPTAAWRAVTGASETPLDATDAFQRALASGARTVYLRHGTYWLSDTLTVPATVRRIMGMGSTIHILPQRQPGFTRDQPIFRIRGQGEPLEIERLALDNTDLGPQVGVQQDSRRTLLLRDMMASSVLLLDRTAEGGPVILENTCCSNVRVAGPAPVVARQLDTEGGGVRIENEGAPLSIIGLKTEGECTAVATTKRGRTEILGGLLFMVNKPSPEGVAAFTVHDSRFQANFIEQVVIPDRGYKVYLRIEDPAPAHDVNASTMPQRGDGHIAILSD